MHKTDLQESEPQCYSHCSQGHACALTSDMSTRLESSQNENLLSFEYFSKRGTLKKICSLLNNQDTEGLFL